MLLKGKTAVITGCRRGIGKTILELFAQHGADVIACVRSESAEFNDYAAKLSAQHGVAVTPVAFDLADEEQVKAGSRAIIGLKKPIDILVNNAGVASGGLFQMTSMQQMKDVFAVNYFGLVLLIGSISRYMARAKKGSIINVASTAGLIGDAGTIGYGASKAALILATKTMATELGASNIRVNAVAPSVTKTDMFDQMDPKARESLIDATALKRPAEPLEVANGVLFLASDLSSYI
ncbi:MAG TPA: SDR family NAD(P)-dependent oxidoreductase, partial [Gemmatimonadaceae bacterium]